MSGSLILDVSNNNPITEQQLRRSGAVALIAKATEGVDFDDSTYEHHKQIALACKIPFGAYYFLHPLSKGNEAAHFLEFAKLMKGHDMDPIVDCEVTDGASMSVVAQRCRETCSALQAGGWNPIIYSSKSFLMELYSYEPILKNYRAWEAQYPTRFGRLLMSWLPGYTALRSKLNNGVSVVMWQWTSSDKVAGGSWDASIPLVKVASLISKPAV